MKRKFQKEIPILKKYSYCIDEEYNKINSKWAYGIITLRNHMPNPALNDQTSRDLEEWA